MHEPKRWTNTLALLLLGVSLTAFGAYLLYEKVALPIFTGVADERGGLTYRTEEPVLFWVSVLMFAAIGLVICSLGVWTLRNAIKGPRK